MKCTNLTNVIISDKVSYIAANAFYGCSSLTSINIPDGVTSIGARAFYDCSSLTIVNIPNSVIYIYPFAFYYCSKLKTVNYRGTEAQWSRIDIRDNNDQLENATINYNYTGE